LKCHAIEGKTTKKDGGEVVNRYWLSAEVPGFEVVWELETKDGTRARFEVIEFTIGK
jgi:hypothetical protein